MGNLGRLTIQDLQESNWQRIIESCSEKTYFSYSSTFLEILNKSIKENDSKNVAIYTLLRNVTSMILNTETPQQPFQCYGFRIESIDDISSEHLDLLEKLVPDVVDPEMRARISDILWVRKRNHRMGGAASQAYLGSFENLMNFDDGFDAVVRIERAVQLGAMLGKKQLYFTSAIKRIEEVLDECNGKDNLFFTHRLLELLLEQKIGEPTKYIALSEKMIQTAEAEREWHKSREYWKCNAEWHSINKDSEARRKSLIARAETYVKEADDVLSNNSPNYMQAVGYIQNAIEVLKRIDQTKDRVDDLHKLLLIYQEKSTSQMKEIHSESRDITDFVNNTVNSIKGKSLEEALITLATLSTSPKVSDLRKAVQDSSQSYKLDYFVSNIAVNKSGKVVGRQPDITSENDKEVEAAIRSKMYRHAQFHQLACSAAIISPGTNQIILEHYVREKDFLPIVSDNRFVPPGREVIYARGLYAGLTGDLLVSTHLLIPQLEDSIRYILYQHGLITSTYDDKGVQDERNLNSLLFIPEVSQILGEDLTFDLQGLLIERFGSNLRNKMAHGLMELDDFNTPSPHYLWWIVLRICCLYKMLEINREHV